MSWEEHAEELFEWMHPDHTTGNCRLAQLVPCHTMAALAFECSCGCWMWHDHGTLEREYAKMLAHEKAVRDDAEQIGESWREYQGEIFAEIYSGHRGDGHGLIEVSDCVDGRVRMRCKCGLALSAFVTTLQRRAERIREVAGEIEQRKKSSSEILDHAALTSPAVEPWIRRLRYLNMLPPGPRPIIEDDSLEVALLCVMAEMIDEAVERHCECCPVRRERDPRAITKRVEVTGDPDECAKRLGDEIERRKRDEQDEDDLDERTAHKLTADEERELRARIEFERRGGWERIVEDAQLSAVKSAPSRKPTRVVYCQGEEDGDI